MSLFDRQRVSDSLVGGCDQCPYLTGRVSVILLLVVVVSVPIWQAACQWFSCWWLWSVSLFDRQSVSDSLVGRCGQCPYLTGSVSVILLLVVLVSVPIWQAECQWFSCWSLWSVSLFDRQRVSDSLVGGFGQCPYLTGSVSVILLLVVVVSVPIWLAACQWFSCWS